MHYFKTELASVNHAQSLSNQTLTPHAICGCEVGYVVMTRLTAQTTGGQILEVCYPVKRCA